MSDKICISLKEAIKINRKWKELNYEMDYLKEQLEILQQKNNNLKKENARLKNKIEDYEKDEPFFEQISKLRKENKILKIKNEKLENYNLILNKLNNILLKEFSKYQKIKTDKNRNIIKEIENLKHNMIKTANDDNNMNDVDNAIKETIEKIDNIEEISLKIRNNKKSNKKYKEKTIFDIKV